MNREIVIHIYIYILCIKYITHENLLSSTGNSSQCCGGLNKSEADSNDSKLYHPDSVTGSISLLWGIYASHIRGGWQVHHTVKHQELLCASQTHEWYPWSYAEFSLLGVKQLLWKILKITYPMAQKSPGHLFHHQWSLAWVHNAHESKLCPSGSDGPWDPQREARIPARPERHLRYSGRWSLSVLVTTRARSLQNPLWQAFKLSFRRSSWALPPEILSMSLITQITEHLSMVCETRPQHV